MDSYQEAALRIFRYSITSAGFVASAHKHDNYSRVWARDAMLTGLAALWAAADDLLPAFEASILTLSRHQHALGAIPSNVASDTNGQKTAVSYGGLVGRVDATTWWIIGAAAYIAYTQNETLKTALLPNIQRAFAILKCYEFNNRGLMYVPLGGNWADEYVTQGYTLYDQLLRLWALQAAAQVWKNEEWQEAAAALRNLLQKNYWLQGGDVAATNADFYHHIAMQKATYRPYWYSSLSPAGYDMRWDMPANALALLLDMGTAAQYDALENYLHDLHQSFGHWLLPVFSPAIFPADKDWGLLKENYAYRFKNEPFHFHNGGAWFIFLGLLGLGLKKQGRHHTAQAILEAMQAALQREQPQPFTFYEYWNPKNQQHGGTAALCFSAAGYLYASCEISNDWNILLL
ncbi:MAG: hypothetical protein IPL35_15335 [Sphingobacteriales bacterium]|nr:hypothetical protein [Sphingobacteriales bacterium]